MVPETAVSDPIDVDDTVGTVSEETVDQDRDIWTELRFVNGWQYRRRSVDYKLPTRITSSELDLMEIYRADMCVILYVDVGFVQVYRYTKDGRWVKSGVKMGSVYEYSVISVLISFSLYGFVFLRFFL